MEIQEMIEVLSNVKSNEKGECVNVDCRCRLTAHGTKGEWHTCKNPEWDFCTTDYRIKPEPKRMPLDYSDMLIRKCVIEKDKNTRRMIVSQATDSVLLSESVLGGGIEWYYYDKLMEYFTFLDGTPCSKESECE